MTVPTPQAEALRLALEALESCTPGDTSTGHVIHPSFDENAVSAAIEAVEAALTTRAPDAGWVKVCERLPEKNVEVLIAFRDVSLPATGQYTASPHDTWGWCFPGENDPEDTGPVIAWQPLPAHPTLPAPPAPEALEVP